MRELPISIKRFKPVDTFRFDPDRPIEYENPIPQELVNDGNDVIRLGDLLYNAEMEAWECRRAKEIKDLLIDSSVAELMEIAKYLRDIRTREARECHQKIMMLITKMKAPLVACVMQCFEGLYRRGRMDAVRAAMENLGIGQQEPFDKGAL